MAQTIEQSQQLVDLRSRMLKNISQGIEPWVGFSQDELKAGMAAIMGGRARTAEAATKGRKEKAKAAAGPPPDMGSLLSDLGLPKLT